MTFMFCVSHPASGSWVPGCSQGMTPEYEATFNFSNMSMAQVGLNRGKALHLGFPSGLLG